MQNTTRHAAEGRVTDMYGLLNTSDKVSLTSASIYLVSQDSQVPVGGGDIGGLLFPGTASPALAPGPAAAPSDLTRGLTRAFTGLSRCTVSLTAPFDAPDGMSAFLWSVTGSTGRCWGLPVFLRLLADIGTSDALSEGLLRSVPTTAG